MMAQLDQANGNCRIDEGIIRTTIDDASASHRQPDRQPEIEVMDSQRPPIRTLCPDCDRRFKLPEESAGRKAQCRCGAIFQVPPLQRFHDEGPNAVLTGTLIRTAGESPSSVGDDEKGRRSRRVFVVVGAAVATITIGSLATIWVLQSTAPNESPVETTASSGSDDGHTVTKKEDIKTLFVKPGQTEIDMSNARPGENYELEFAEGTYEGEFRDISLVNVEHLDAHRDNPVRLVVSMSELTRAKANLSTVGSGVAATVLMEKNESAKDFIEDAEAGDAEAQSELASCYYVGDGVEKSVEEAVTWWRRAAEQGHAKAAGELAACYVQGEGVPKSSADGMRWMERAAANGDAFRQYGLATFYDGGQYVERDRSEAARWYEKAAVQGDVKAQVRLAHMQELGIGVDRDLLSAAFLRTEAADRGNAESKRWIDDLQRAAEPRTDGIYIDEDGSRPLYLRFYSDGLVLWGSFDKPPRNIYQTLDRRRKSELPSGTYTATGSHINFTITYRESINEFTGTINGDTIRMYRFIVSSQDEGLSDYTFRRR